MSDTPAWRDPTQIHAGRSLVLAATGAVIGLIIAGYGLFTARGTSTLLVPPEDVALVNQQPLSRVDFVGMLKSLYDVDLADSTPEQRRKILEDMIREEVYVQRGKDLDLASVDPDVRGAMVAAVEQVSATSAITDQPTEDKLRAHYDANRTLFTSAGTMDVRDYLFKDAAAVAGAVTALRSGKPADSVLAANGGRDSAKVSSEEFYFAAKIHLGDALFTAAAAMATGAVSEPIEADGIHVLQMVKNTPPTQYTYEDARVRVLDDYRKKAITRAQANMEMFLRKRANVLISEDLR